MIHPSTGTLVSTSCWHRGWGLIQHPDLQLKDPPFQVSKANCIRPTIPASKLVQGAHTLCLQPQQLVGMESCSITLLVLYILAPGTSFCIPNGTIYNKDNRPEEAMLFVIVKACLQFMSFLILLALENYVPLIYNYIDPCKGHKKQAWPWQLSSVHSVYLFHK